MFSLGHRLPAERAAYQKAKQTETQQFEQRLVGVSVWNSHRNKSNYRTCNIMKFTGSVELLVLSVRGRESTFSVATYHAVYERKLIDFRHEVFWKQYDFKSDRMLNDEYENICIILLYEVLFPEDDFSSNPNFWIFGPLPVWTTHILWIQHALIVQN